MITTAKKRQRGTPREARQTAARLQVLQEEVLALKRQVAEMEQSIMAANMRTHLLPQTRAELKPRRLPPPGMTAMQAIQGQWPGDETTSELLAQLKVLK